MPGVILPSSSRLALVVCEPTLPSIAYVPAGKQQPHPQAKAVLRGPFELPPAPPPNAKLPGPAYLVAPAPCPTSTTCTFVSHAPLHMWPMATHPLTLTLTHPTHTSAQSAHAFVHAPPRPAPPVLSLTRA